MIDKHQAFEAWYKANYAHIAGTSSWVERARAAYYAGARSTRDRVAELERERKMSNRASQQRDMLMLSLGLCLVTGSPDERGMVNPKWVNARAESAEQRVTELETIAGKYEQKASCGHAMRYLTGSTPNASDLICGECKRYVAEQRVESLSEENRKLRELIVYFYGGRFSSYWSELQEWKRTGATHAPGALVERDYEKAKELAALLRPSEAMTGKVEKGEPND
jgi:hypothetical protein